MYCPGPPFHQMLIKTGKHGMMSKENPWNSSVPFTWLMSGFEDLSRAALTSAWNTLLTADRTITRLLGSKKVEGEHGENNSEAIGTCIWDKNRENPGDCFNASVYNFFAPSTAHLKHKSCSVPCMSKYVRLCQMYVKVESLQHIIL